MEKKKFQKLVECIAQDINNGTLDISWMFADEENCMNMQNEKPHKYTENSDNYAQTLYPWCNEDTTENKWREYTLEESGLTHEQDNII